MVACEARPFRGVWMREKWDESKTLPIRLFFSRHISRATKIRKSAVER